MNNFALDEYARMNSTGSYKVRSCCVHCPYLNHLARCNDDTGIQIVACPVCSLPRCNECAAHYGVATCPIDEGHNLNGGQIPIV